MIVSINEQTVQESEIKGDNLEEILAHMQENHIQPDHAIGEVLLNGSSYSEDLPHAAVEIEREEIKTLDVITRSPEEISHHFLEHGSLVIDTLTESLPKITEMFRLGDETEANEHFLRFLESLHLLVSMLERAAGIIGLSLDARIGDQESLNDRLAALAGSLGQLIEIQEQTDWIYLADLLEYELTPELEAFRDILPKLKSTAH